MAELKPIRMTGPNGTEVGFAGLNGAISGAFGYNGFFYKLTQILGYLSIVIALVFAEEGIEQLIKRKSLKAIDGEIIVTGVLYVLTAIVYLFFEIVKIHIAINDKRCIVNFLYNTVFFVKFIIDITNYLLNYVFYRYDTADSAVFIYQDREMLFFFLQFSEQSVYVLCLWHKVCRS